MSLREKVCERERNGERERGIARAKEIASEDRCARLFRHVSCTHGYMSLRERGGEEERERGRGRGRARALEGERDRATVRGAGLKVFLCAGLRIQGSLLPRSAIGGGGYLSQDSRFEP